MNVVTAEKIFQVIYEAFKASGGAYENGVSRKTQENIVIALATDQFVIKIRDGQVKWFAAWRRVEDVEHTEQREYSDSPLAGDMICVTEAICTDGMMEMVRAIRKKCKGLKGCMWHRPAKNDRFHAFLRQKGGEE